MSTQLELWHDIALQQMAAEAYFERVNLGVRDEVLAQLDLGNNRVGFTRPDGTEEGFTRFTTSQADDFVNRFQIVHQMSDDPRRPRTGSAYFADSSVLANTGLSATLIRRKTANGDLTNEYTLAIRSTEYRPVVQGGDRDRDVFGADLQGIFSNGLALAQLAALNDYFTWLKSSGNLPAGSVVDVTGYSLGGHLATVFTEMHASDIDGMLSRTYTFNGAGRGTWSRNASDPSAIVNYYRAVLFDPSVAAQWVPAETPDRPEDEAVRGLYANASARSAASQLFDAVSIYGDPRHEWAQYAARQQFGLSGASVLDQGSSDLRNGAEERITQIYGKEFPIEATGVANAGVHGPATGVFVEAQPFLEGGLPDWVPVLGGASGWGNAHALILIVDALAVMRVYQALDSDVTLETLNQLFSAFSNKKAQSAITGEEHVLAEDDPLENALDALRRFFLGGEVSPTGYRPGASGFGDVATREELHGNIAELAGRIALLKATGGAQYSIQSLVDMPANAIEGLATLDDDVGRAYRYALKHLNPFVVTVAAGPQPEAYSDPRLAVFDAQRSPQGMSLEYLKDRAEFLAWTIQRNQENTSAVLRRADVTGPTEFRDLALAESAVYIDGPSGTLTPNPTRTHVLFASPESDGIFGGRLPDRLYAEAGPDLLQGGRGDDYMEGGEGMDVYVYRADTTLFVPSNDGNDTIFDADGNGLLQYSFQSGIGSLPQTRVIGGAALKLSENQWWSADGKFIYEKAGADLQVTISGDAGGGFVLRNFDFEKARADGWLGIRLVDPVAWPSFEPLPLPQTQGQPILGDLEPLVQTGTVPALKISENPPTWIPDLSGNPDWRLKAVIDVATGSAGPVSYTIEYHQVDGNGNLIRTAAPAPGMNDFLHDSPGNDAINAGQGDNIVQSLRGGDDWIYAGDGVDTVTDLSGNNRIETNGGSDTIFTGDANDHIAAGDGEDSIQDTGGNNRIDGGAGADVIGTGPGDDWVIGGPGGDSITSAAGKNLLEGNAGRDVILGGTGADAIEGGVDADLLWGRDSNDQIWGDIGGSLLGLAQAIALGETALGEAGQGDLISGDAGDDILVGSNRADLMAGGADRDIIAGGGSDDTIYGDHNVLSAPFDWHVVRTVDDSGPVTSYVVTRSAGLVTGSDLGAADTIYAGAGADWVFAGGGGDHVDGGSGNDVLLGEEGSDILLGGDGNDVLDGDSFQANEEGTFGDDFLDGSNGDDFLFGGKGKDVLFGGVGEDQLLGGDGDDLLYGGTATDVLQGGHGKDTYVYFRGDGVDVVIDPDIGSDSEYRSALALGPDIARSQIKFRLGSLIVDLGEGDAIQFEGFDPEDVHATAVLGAIHFADGDFMSFEDILAQGFVVEGTSGDDFIVGTSLRELIDAGAGNDVVEGMRGNDEIAGGGGDDELDGDAGDDALLGGAGSDVLLGGAGNDMLDAGDGSDVLLGGSGDDTLAGGGGDDYLDGGAGNDVLAGGAGTDIYLLRGGMGADTLTDGELGESNVLLLGAGVTRQGLAPKRVDDSLVLTLRGTSDSVTISDYFTRPQSWTVRDVVGVETSLEAVIAQPDPYSGDFIAGLWGDLKAGATARLMARGYEIGWKALDQDTFEMFQEYANLQYASQSTTQTIFRAEAPFDILSQNTTVDTQETVLNFGLRTGSTFHWALQNLETARLESDEPVIVGNLGTQPIVETPGQAVLSLRREGPVFGEQHTTWSSFGGVISHDSGTETVLANVRYEYDLHSYRQSARVTNVSPGAGSWQLPADTVAGNRVLVDMRRVEHRHVGLLELIGGDSDNVIYATGAVSPFEMALLVDAGAGDDLVLGGGLVLGNDGNDDLRSSPLLVGGNGDDRLEGSRNARFVFTSSEVGIDTLVAPWTAATEYIDWYYQNLGMADWSERFYEGGKYAAFVLEIDEVPELQYFDTLEDAEAEGGTDIRYVEPLDIFAPVLRRDDTATLEAFAAAGGLSRDVALFGPGISLEDLELAVTVNGPSSLAYSGQPWNIGGTLSVRWNDGLAGFDVDVPDANYGFTGTNLVLEGWDSYRVGEGIEAFEFTDGGIYSLEDVLARAAVVLDFGYRLLRGSGSHVIDSHWGGVDFAGDIAPTEVSAYRDGSDLVLVLADGSAQATIPGWYADPSAFTSWFLHFADGTVLDAAAMDVLGVTRKGTEGADVLVGDPELPGFLFGYGGDDTLTGGAGDDYLDGGEGTDTYVFNVGGGTDVIADAGPSVIVFDDGVPSWSVNFSLGSLVVRYGEGDSIHFTAFDADDPQATRVFERLEFADGSSLAYEDFLQIGFGLTGGDADDVITGSGIRDAIFGGGGNDNLYGGGGSDDLYGGEGDDTLSGGPGDNDSLAGEAGADTYIFAPGDGRDDVYEWGETPGEEDRVLLQDFEPSDVQVTRNPWNYYLVMGGGDRLTLTSTAIEPAAIVERIEFEDGTVWTPTDLEARVELLPGTSGDDVLWGTAGADTIYGLGGYDELYGNAGDDFLAGSEGDDFYYFAAGDGHDTVYDYDTDGGYGSLYFASVSSTDAALSREGTSLVVTVGADSVTLSDWYLGPDYRIDAIDFAGDGGYWDAAMIEAMAPAAGNSAPVVAIPLTDVSFEAGASFSFGVPEGTFFDADPNDTLAFSASRYDGGPLPSWLSFDPATAVFTGNPALAEIGVSHILVTAADSAGASAQSDFGLVVRVPAGMEATGTAGDDVIYGGTGDETLTAKGGSDYLYGDAGNDLLKGGGGNDVLQGGAGNDVLRGGKGQNLLDGGTGDDLIFGGAGSAFILGGAGNDTLRVGSGNDVIAFNAGDGLDTVYGGRDGGNTLSFGGGIGYSDLSLSRSGKDLLVSAGAGDGLLLKNWYAGNHSVLNLQIVLDATEEFDAGSGDPLYNRRVQTFDFLGMVSAYDAARVETPGLTSWAMTNALLAFHLSGADDLALGGDLAYWYGKNRTLQGISLQSAQQVIGAAGFGSEAQSLRPFSGLQEGFVKLV